ncbi:hypothetical protein GCM10027614_08170 [Micromonospora vulcania]
MTTLDRDETHAPAVPPRPADAHRPLPLRVAVPMAVAAGLALLAAFPRTGCGRSRRSVWRCWPPRRTAGGCAPAPAWAL